MCSQPTLRRGVHGQREDEEFVVLAGSQAKADSRRGIRVRLEVKPDQTFYG